MKRNKLFLSLCVLFSALSWVSVSAQISEGGTPPSFNFENTLKFTQQPYVVNFTGDIQKLKLEDEILVQNGGPQRTGMPISVDININKTGKWTTLSDGQEIWQQTLKSPGATALFIVYDDLYIPEGGKLYLYTIDKKQVIGAFTHKNTPNGGVFVTEPLFQDEVVFEYVKSKVSDEAPRLSVSRVAYMYNVVNPYEINEADLSCMIDVNCPEGDNWQKQKRGVLQLTYLNKSGQSYICSGSLVNNLRQDGTPYVLSADHCFSDLETHEVLTNFSTMVVKFNYEFRECGGKVRARSYTLAGAEPLVQIPIKDNSDGFLFKMNEESIPSNFNAYYNGWVITETLPLSGVVIHHPEGYEKKISTYNRSAVNIGATMMSDGIKTGENSHIGIRYTKTESGHGVIAPGSSGSPIFNQDGLIIGTLTGGTATCAKPTGRDIYGKLWFHWNQYGTDPAGHMKTYLDPDNTGATALLGYDPATDEPGNPLSIGDVENANNKALLFPSPFTDNLNINAGDILRTVKVFDLSGRSVYEANNLSSSTLTIPASAWTKGSYIVVLETEKGKETHKVIK